DTIWGISTLSLMLIGPLLYLGGMSCLVSYLLRVRRSWPLATAAPSLPSPGGGTPALPDFGSSPQARTLHQAIEQAGTASFALRLSLHAVACVALLFFCFAA